MERSSDKQRPINALHYTQYGWEGTVSSPLSEFDIPVSSRDGSEDYVKLCAAAFLGMSDGLLDRLLRATAAYVLENAPDGLEWAVRYGDPVYVGEYIGCDPWESYPSEDNYINRI